MKILLVNDYGDEVGGVETYITSLKRELVDRGNDVRILTATSDQHLAVISDYTFPGINTKSWFRVLPYVFNVRSLWALRRILKEFKPDVVHLQYTFYHCSPSILAALRNYPTVYTFHAYEILAPLGLEMTPRCRHAPTAYCWHCHPLPRYLADKLKRFVFSRLSDVIDVYVSPNRHFEEIYRSHGIRNVVYIPNGIDLMDVRPLQFGKQLLFVGRLERSKGVGVLIEAMLLINQQVPESRLVVVGSGSFSEELKDMVSRMSLDGVVKFAGRVNHKDVGKFYADSDIVVMPSLRPEAFGIVGVEALSVGRPVIGTNVGGISDWLVDGTVGMLVPPNDSNALAAAAARLLTDKALLMKMAESARGASEAFSMGQHADRISSLYREYAERGRRAI
jgi:glycosyltransferase involved in cell wall biosynthesis